MNKPRAIFFDLDETLVENVIPVRKLFGEMYYQFAEQLGEDNREMFFAALQQNAQNLWATMFASKESPEAQFISCFATTIGSLKTVPADNVDTLATAMFNRFSELSASNVKLNEGSKQVLETLHKTGFITGIITNGMEQVQMGKITALNLQQQVDHVIISAQAQAHKPHAAVFELALRKAKVKPQQAWHIGDHSTNDVAGAIRAGLTGIYYNPEEKDTGVIFSELDERPNHVIQKLTELVDLLKLKN